ncbi:MAG: DNA polymerase I, partial [Spirochaetes bacterium]|nr:DNA polymerase I [Spirochaetota bacterium]
DNLQNIYNNLDKISSKSAKVKLEENKENAFLSQNLATIKKDIPFDINWEEWANKPLNINKAISLLKKDSLKTIIDKILQYNQDCFGSVETGLFMSIQPDKASIQSNETESIQQDELKSLTKEYKFVSNKEKIYEKIKKIKKIGHFCFDIETTGFNFLSDEIICINIATKDEVFIIPLYISPFQQTEADIKIDKNYIKQTIELLKILFEDKNILKIGHNLKFDIKFLQHIGISINGNLFDTMLAEYCLDASNNILSMDDLAEKYLSYSTIHYKDIIDNPKKDTLQDVSIVELAKYAGEDADITYQLYEILKNKLESNKKTEALFYEIEIPLLKVLINMEFYGVSINKDYLIDLSVQLEKEIKNITVKLTEIAGEEFNPNSPKQIAEILFNKLKLPIIKKAKTGPSTDVGVLKKLSLVHPIASELLEYRTISKIKSTYSDSLPSIVNPISGKIHTTYLQTGTQTGRLASKSPNLQNIPVKTKIGKKIRLAFIPSPNNILVSADYSQVELFLLAEFSKDPNLFEAFKSDQDIHLKTASLIFDKNVGDITKEERSIGKTINFSILYGQGAHSLSENLEISRKEAADFINKYFNKYSDVSSYMEHIKEKCKKSGYAETYWGRRRTIPEIHDANKMRLANGERMAVNTTIQGTAADLIKISMIRIWDKFRVEKIRSRLIMQVHDELIFDVIPEEKDKVIRIIKEYMENGFDFNLQLKTSIKIGKNWGELE